VDRERQLLGERTSAVTVWPAGERLGDHEAPVRPVSSGTTSLQSTPPYHSEVEASSSSLNKLKRQVIPSNQAQVLNNHEWSAWPTYWRHSPLLPEAMIFPPARKPE